MNKISECCRLDRRRQAILDAARELFISKGYEQTTLGDVVEAAGGSLSTIYKLFGNKDGLLDAVVFAKVVSGAEMIRQVVDDEPDPVKALSRIARELYHTHLEAEAVALVRVVIAHSIRDKSFAERFFTTTAMRSRDAVEAALHKWRAEGLKFVGSPSELADMLLGLMVVDMQTQAISHGLKGVVDDADIDYRITFFLRGAGLLQADSAG